LELDFAVFAAFAFLLLYKHQVNMTIRHVAVAIVFGMLVSTSARAELLHVELKALGMN
jgi:hypothetical protein